MHLIIYAFTVLPGGSIAFSDSVINQSIHNIAFYYWHTWKSWNFHVSLQP
jgi:hypothetical protein